MEFYQIYCNNCKKMLGCYNKKFFSGEKIGHILKINHKLHVKLGHEIDVKTIIKN